MKIEISQKSQRSKTDFDLILSWIIGQFTKANNTKLVLQLNAKVI